MSHGGISRSGRFAVVTRDSHSPPCIPLRSTACCLLSTVVGLRWSLGPLHSHADAPCGAVRARILPSEISTTPLFTVARCTARHSTARAAGRGGVRRRERETLRVRKPQDCACSNSVCGNKRRGGSAARTGSAVRTGYVESSYARGASASL